jgi:hypothetical protein
MPHGRDAPASDSPGPNTTHKGGTLKNRKAAIKFRVYKTCLTLASIAAIIEVLGAGRRF